jgi:tripartite-type tricarboxylate transporter receptor subunit TctC
MTATHLGLAILSVVLVPVSSVVYGQDFPARPVRILVSSPGGTSDIVGRSMVPVLSQRLGQSVIIQNSPGLSGVIVAKAVPDGHTVLIEGGNFWTQHLIEPTSYDFLKDFAPVTLTTIATSLLVVHPSVPAKSAMELIALAKTQPGKLNYGSSGVGSGANLNMELFKAMAARVDIVHIPYKHTYLHISGRSELQYSTLRQQEEQSEWIDCHKLLIDCA